MALSDFGVFLVLVDFWLVLDVLGLVCVTEGGHGLVKVEIGGADVGYHYGFGVASQRVLEKTG